MVTMGIDLGTQSIKVLVFDFSKKEIVFQDSEKLDLIIKDGGVREQKAEDWIDSISTLFYRIPLPIRNEIDGIAVSGQQHGFVPLSLSKGVLYNVKLWCDTSTVKECNEIVEKYGGEERLIAKIGNPILPGYTASKIYWLKKYHQDLFNAMDYVLLPHDYINYWLTGCIEMERGDSSGTGLMNIYTGVWDNEICSIIDETLITKLPPIAVNAKIIGKIKDEFSSKYGFRKDVVVVSGGGDNMMSLIGSGSISDGDITMSLGTSGTLFASSSFPVVDKEARLAAFCSSHGSWLPLLCTMNCTVATELMRGFFDVDVRDFDSLASKSTIGANGLLFLPFLNGERTPNLPNGKGVLSGITCDNLTKENISRATIEGVTYEFLLGLNAFASLGITPKIISLTGGGAKSSFWRQLVADVTGCNVRVPFIGESAAFGASIQAYWIISGEKLTNVIEQFISFDNEKNAFPNMENHCAYKACYKEWLRYVDSLSVMFK